MPGLTPVKSLGSLVTKPIVAYMGSFPPRECGIATFTRDLTEAVDAASPLLHPSQIIALNESDDLYDYGHNVKYNIIKDEITTYRDAARRINQSKIELVCIQHEFGLFGGVYGNYLLAFLDAVRKPVIVTFHTVLSNPDPDLLKVVRAIAEKTAGIVVLAEKAREILRRDYQITSAVHFVPHGAPDVRHLPTERFKKVFNVEGHTVLSTFGLLGPGKGIEYAIKALPGIIAKDPTVIYLILGETHPGERRHNGESYRNQLTDLVHELGLKKHVKFNNRYLGQPELIRYLQATDVYIMPYLDPGQIASGTLAYAVACGKAIVATPFVYAKEILGQGRGLLSEFRDSQTITLAVNRYLSDPEFRHKIESAAYTYGRQTIWSAVAHKYISIFHHAVVANRPVPAFGFAHLTAPSFGDSADPTVTA